MPFKCPGAPLKIVYLAADDLRRRGVLADCDVQFFTATPAIFGVPFIAQALKLVAKRYGIPVNLSHNLVAVDGMNRKASFEIVSEDRKGQWITVDFDMLHVTPSQRPPVVVRNIPRTIEGHEPEGGYDGYASCSLTTARGKVIMAEFVYGGKVTPTLPLDPAKGRWMNRQVKVTGLPLM